MLGQEVMARADPWRHVLELDPHQQDEFSEMKNAIVSLGKDDNLVPGLLQELASPALPPHWLTSEGFSFTLQAGMPSPGRTSGG
jgi:hypothetical protein